jgi:putative endonuclease
MVSGLPNAAIAKEAALNFDLHTPLDRTARGRAGEQVAASFLSERGYRVLTKNQRTPMGELDLVCLDGVEVVVVEVKARYDDEYGSALEAIGPRKVMRLRTAALWWLADRALLPCRIRFDAVIVDLDWHGLPRSVQHLRDVVGP